jgi:hypothetical protein
MYVPGIRSGSPPCDKLPVKNGKLAMLVSQASHAIVSNLSRSHHKLVIFCHKLVTEGSTAAVCKYQIMCMKILYFSLQIYYLMI